MIHIALFRGQDSYVLSDFIKKENVIADDLILIGTVSKMDT